MSYLQTVNAVESAANTVNPTGMFDHGRVVDASQAFRGPFPVIWLYPMNTDIPSPGGPEFIDDNVLLIGFWKQDKPASTTAERKQIIADMDTLARAFLVQLVADKLIRIIGKIREEPQYQMYNGTVSGVALRLTYQNFAPCP